MIAGGCRSQIEEGQIETHKADTGMSPCRCALGCASRAACHRLTSQSPTLLPRGQSHIDASQPCSVGLWASLPDVIRSVILAFIHVVRCCFIYRPYKYTRRELTGVAPPPGSVVNGTPDGVANVAPKAMLRQRARRRNEAFKATAAFPYLHKVGSVRSP